MLMKKGVLIFGLVFVSFMVVLTFARFGLVNDQTGINGNVIGEDYNLVFSWRDFSLEVKNISVNQDSADVFYGINEFTNNSQTIDVSFYIGLDENNLKYVSKDSVVASANSETVYNKRFIIPSSGQYVLSLEASNGRKISTDSQSFVFTKNTLSGNVIQEVKDSNAKNVILIAIGIVLIIIVIIEIRKRRRVLDHYKSKHQSRFISLDLR